MLNRERSEPGVSHKRAADSSFDAHSPEYHPVPSARTYGLAMGLAEEIVAEGEDFFDWAWSDIDARICDDPGQRAQCQQREPELRIVSNDLIEPSLADGMPIRISAEGMDQDVHVRQDCLIRPT